MNGFATRIVLAAALAAGVSACGKDKEASASGEGGGGVDVEARKLELGTLAIEVGTPKGWDEGQLGSRAMTYTAPSKQLYRSVMMVSATCQGSCSSIPDNMKGAAAQQVEMHQGSFDSVKIVREGAIDGGHEFELEMAKSNGTARQYVVLRYQDGWDLAGQCSMLVMPEDVGKFAELSALCKQMKVALKQ